MTRSSTFERWSVQVDKVKFCFVLGRTRCDSACVLQVIHRFSCSFVWSNNLIFEHKYVEFVKDKGVYVIFIKQLRIMNQSSWGRWFSLKLVPVWSKGVKLSQLKSSEYNYPARHAQLLTLSVWLSQNSSSIQNTLKVIQVIDKRTQGLTPLVQFISGI